jgi:hypothetical protein
MVLIAMANGFSARDCPRYLGDYGSHLYKTAF